jgi:hypothetical protein
VMVGFALASVAIFPLTHRIRIAAYDHENAL